MKISFEKPVNLDGAKLVDELIAAGVEVAQENNKPKWVEVDGDGVLWIDIESDENSAVENVVKNHKGTIS